MECSIYKGYKWNTLNIKDIQMSKESHPADHFMYVYNRVNNSTNRFIVDYSHEKQTYISMVL